MHAQETRTLNLQQVVECEELCLVLYEDDGYY